MMEKDDQIRRAARGLALAVAAVVVFVGGSVATVLLGWWGVPLAVLLTIAAFTIHVRFDDWLRRPPCGSGWDGGAGTGVWYCCACEWRRRLIPGPTGYHPVELRSCPACGHRRCRW